MSYGAIVTTPPAAEPITLKEAKYQLNMSPTMIRDDAFIVNQLIPQVRTEFEDYTQRACITQVRQFTADYRPRWCNSRWHYGLYLPFAPVQSIDLVEYLDKEYTWQEIADEDYRLVNDREPAIMEPDRSSSTEWPETAAQRAALRITYTCGYGADSMEVPPDVKGCLLRMLESRYRFRGEGELPQELYWAMDQLRLGDEFVQYGHGPARGIVG